MTSPKSRIFAAVVGALGLSAGAAWADVATPEQRVAELEAKVAALEARQAAASKDVAATIDRVLRDAERRSQLLAADGGSSAGYDNGFYIRLGDGWVLRPGVQFQFRNVTNYRDGGDDDGEGGGDDDETVENGFEVRRLKFELSGTAFTKDLEYAFVWATERNGGSLFLQDAWVKYMFADDWGFRVGQFKDPVHHEELVSSKRQMAADRSLVNELIGGGITDRVQGVSLIYGGYNKNNPINVEVAFTDGANTDNTDFLKPSGGTEWGVAGRVEFLAMGDWNAYRDFTAKGTKENLLVIGGGFDWTQMSDPSDFDDALFLTVDAQFETSGGLGLYGALLYNRLFDAGGSDDDLDQWGGLVQVSYLLNPSWEIFGRYSYTDLDEEGDAEEDEFHEITVGVNYYLGTDGSALHRAKVTIDVTYLPEGSPGITGLGYLPTGEDDDEWVVRGQFQLLI